MWNAATGSWEDLTEGSGECKSVNGKMQYLDCASRIWDNVSDLTSCGDFTYEVSFEVPCENLETSKENIQKAFEEKYRAMGFEKTLDDVSVLTYGNCDAKIPAERPADNTPPVIPAPDAIARRLNGNFALVEVEMDLNKPEDAEKAMDLAKDFKAALEYSIGEFEETSEDGTTNQKKNDVPDWLSTAVPEVKGPVLLNTELSICEIIAEGDKEFEILKKQFNTLGKKVKDLKDKDQTGIMNKISSWWSSFVSYFGIESSKELDSVQEAQDDVGKQMVKTAATEVIAIREEEAKVTNGEKTRPGTTKALQKQLRMLADGNMNLIQAKYEHEVLV
jgi:hypothetical protein